MQAMLDYSIFGNAILAYLTALAILIGGIVVVYVFKRLILKRLKNGPSQPTLRSITC